ncbi:hypothetical protein K8T06_08130 [bacterium]|nr:hypothetical protein [bacterium]
MKDCSCEQMLELVNELIDGELSGSKLEEVERLLKENPKCQKLFQTISQTISLYRLRCLELNKIVPPEFDWGLLKKESENT